MLAITAATTTTSAAATIILQLQKCRSDTSIEGQRNETLLLSKLIMKRFKKRA